MKQNKYSYLYVLQGLYYGKWEDLTCTDKKDKNAYKEIKNDKKRIKKMKKGFTE